MTDAELKKVIKDAKKRRDSLPEWKKDLIEAWYRSGMREDKNVNR